MRKYRIVAKTIEDTTRFVVQWVNLESCGFFMLGKEEVYYTFWQGNTLEDAKKAKEFYILEDRFSKEEGVEILD